MKVFHSAHKRGVDTRRLRREMRRRSAVEAVIGHMKIDGRMDRCRLKGRLGDAMNAVLAAAGHNIRLLLRAMAAFLRLALRALLQRMSMEGHPDVHSAPTMSAACPKRNKKHE